MWFPTWLGGIGFTKDGDSTVGTVDTSLGLGVGVGKGKKGVQKYLGGWEISLNPGPWNIKVSFVSFRFI